MLSTSFVAETPLLLILARCYLEVALEMCCDSLEVQLQNVYVNHGCSASCKGHIVGGNIMDWLPFE
jgi:hypothetical protein